LEIGEIITAHLSYEKTEQLINHLETIEGYRAHLNGLTGSSRSLTVAAVAQKFTGDHIIVMPDKESSAYFLNDLESIFDEKAANFHKKKILFFPTSYKRNYDIIHQDSTHVLLRTEVLKRLGSGARKSIIVTYPEALAEKVVRKAYLTRNTIKLKRKEAASIDTISDLLNDNDFDRVDFVYEPGQFSIRGGIIDVFSFTNDYPYRIEFFGDEVESIRSFNPVDQLSVDTLDHITIVPNIQDRKIVEKRESFLSYIPENTVIWIDDLKFTTDRIGFESDKAAEVIHSMEEEFGHFTPQEFFIDGKEFVKLL